ncbi:MAG: hypothetical protein CVU19_17340 [Betaproteobacteria bacterium HGW-Betaproteobacteria-13]|nr:MAG: hypothetical protein CVU19_17340 [Betaproteobacteria bacterium HGW-Betaproteobacteria-13]
MTKTIAPAAKDKMEITSDVFTWGEMEQTLMARSQVNHSGRLTHSYFLGIPSLVLPPVILSTSLSLHLPSLST